MAGQADDMEGENEPCGFMAASHIPLLQSELTDTHPWKRANILLAWHT